MPNGDVVVGQRLQWKRISDEEEKAAIVTAVRTNEQEGLGLQIEDFASLWIDVRGLSPGGSPAFTIMLGTDGKAYLDGEEILTDL